MMNLWQTMLISSIVPPCQPALVRGQQFFQEIFVLCFFFVALSFARLSDNSLDMNRAFVMLVII